jgi:toxin FitB
VNFLIDTNIISELRKGGRCDRGVASWYEQVAGESLYLSVLVLGEIRKGVELIRARDPSQARVLERWLLAVADEFGERVLPVNREIADEWGRMNAIRPLPNPDGLLAATAKVHAMTFVTRDCADMAGFDVVLFNPFKATKS